MPDSPAAASIAAGERGFRVRALGEVAIRCRDIEAMTAFYRDVIGLAPLRGDGPIRFLRIAEGHGGHIAVLALFAADAPDRRGAPPGDIDGVETGARSSLHHVALTVDLAEQDAAIAWYARIGQPCRVEEFDWIGWRGVFTTDPEGNTVELVAATGAGRGDA